MLRCGKSLLLRALGPATQHAAAVGSGCSTSGSVRDWWLPDLSSPPTTAWHQPLCRGFAKVVANDLRSGAVVIRSDGRLQRVLKFHKNAGQARASGTVTVDFLDLRTQNHSSEKMNPLESLEVAEMDGKTLQVLYTEGKTVHLLDPTTFDQIALDQSMFGDGSKWLSTPDLEVDVKTYKDEIVSGSVPTKIAVKVLKVPQTTTSREDGHSTRHATVDGGHAVTVPSFIKEGHTIIIRTEDGTYIERKA